LSADKDRPVPDTAIYRSLVEETSDWIWEMDVLGRYSYVNPVVGRLLGYAPCEMIGQPAIDFLSGQAAGPDAARLRSLLADQRPFAGFEASWTAKTGQLVMLESSGLPFVDGAGRLSGFRGISRDVSSRREAQNRMQEKLMRSERLAATGLLAASIAHEINSPLQGVLALLSVVKTQYSADSDLLQQIDLIRSAFNSIRDMTRRLLDLNRPAMEATQPVMINRVIEETVALLQGHLKRHKVVAELNLGDALPRIIASPQQLGQLILNLINNAVEAISGVSAHDTGLVQQTFFGGKISIKSSMTPAHIRIDVADNGPGISEEDLPHLFEPFYTRKKAAGMGIGLSICQSIVEACHGTLCAANHPDGGAVFSISLPYKAV
jgi:two-component system, sporulation sensor kinase E